MISPDAPVNGWLRDVLEAEENIYIMTTSRYNDGGAGHPSYAGHQVVAQELITFIKQNDLL
jgi:hypothetical protein